MISNVPEQFSRRALLAGAGALLTSTSALPAPAAAAPHKLKVTIFSKHLQFVKGDELAQTAAEIGFDGIDITVRKGGHIEPERVRQELPGLVAIIRKHGLEVPMITTDIVDTTTPYTEDILRTMADLGIHHYRWGGFKYTDNMPIIAQLEAMRPGVEKLAALNAKYKAGAMYHTHSGVNLVGASFWDLYVLLKGVDPNAAGVNFDIGHAAGGRRSRRMDQQFPHHHRPLARHRRQRFRLGEECEGHRAAAVDAARRRHGEVPGVLHDGCGIGLQRTAPVALRVRTGHTGGNQDIHEAGSGYITRLPGAGEPMSIRRREFMALPLGMPALLLAAPATDARIEELTTSFEDFTYRAPYKFGGKQVDRVTVLNVRCRLSLKSGKSAEGFASMSMGNIWAFPAPLPYDTTLEAMKNLADRIAEITRGFREYAHPLDVDHQLAPEYLKAAADVSRELKLDCRFRSSACS